MQQIETEKDCIYCSKPIRWDHILKVWVDVGTGNVHRDRRSGTTIDTIAENTTEILRQLELLRKAVWENGQRIG